MQEVRKAYKFKVEISLVDAPAKSFDIKNKTTTFVCDNYGTLEYMKRLIESVLSLSMDEVIMVARNEAEKDANEKV